VFEPKKDSSINTDYNLEEQILLYSNNVFRIKIQSVVLPPNYLPVPKTEAEVIDWLRNRIQSKWSSAYTLALKYGEKPNIKLQKKEPYNNN
jgi:hypothetical protein